MTRGMAQYSVEEVAMFADQLANQLIDKGWPLDLAYEFAINFYKGGVNS